jgi:arylsulfatase A-like enzyme
MLSMLAAAAAVATLDSQEMKQPNVLFLLTDDQRWSTVGAFGVEPVFTPAMDRLVAEGTTFTNCYIQGSMGGAVCVPSRAMMMTGRKPYDGTRIPPEHGMIGETFRAAGYDTFSTGKWHQDRAAFNRSFNHGGNIYFGGMHQYHTGGHRTPILTDFDPSGKYPKELTKTYSRFSSELFADATVDFLRNRDSENPFFAYVSFTSPHDPRHAPEWFQSLYPDEEMDLPENFMTLHPFDNGTLRIRDEDLGPYPRTKESVKREIALYFGMVTEVDYQIGRILDELDQLGITEETIVVFASDHGLAVGQHGLLGKQNVYEHSVKPPMVLRGPGIPQSEKRDTFINLHDINPTLIELAGLKPADTVEAKSFAAAVSDAKVVHRESAAMGYAWHQRALRRGKWKLIEYMVKGEASRQLFDLDSDPFELHNLIDHPLHQKVGREMHAELAQMLRDRGDVVDIDKPEWGVDQTISG